MWYICLPGYHGGYPSSLCVPPRYTFVGTPCPVHARVHHLRAMHGTGAVQLMSLLVSGLKERGLPERNLLKEEKREVYERRGPPNRAIPYGLREREEYHRFDSSR